MYTLLSFMIYTHPGLYTIYEKPKYVRNILYGSDNADFDDDDGDDDYKDGDINCGINNVNLRFSCCCC